jgi:hypothetical protein
MAGAGDGFEGLGLGRRLEEPPPQLEGDDVVAIPVEEKQRNAHA